ncbi:hypothetical protein V8C86DRAFT_3083014 [Haematococcus lacustris]
MTGRFKARRAGPEQGGPHLLVLEVRPLPQAAAQTDFTTPATGQDQEGPAKEVAGAEEVPAAALTGLPTTRGASQQGDLMEAVLADAAPASAPDQACCSGQSTTGNSQGQGGESELSSGPDFRQQPAAGAPWTPDIDATLAAAAQAGAGDAPTGRPTPCMAAGQAVPGAVQAMAPPLAAQGPPSAGLPGLPSTGGEFKTSDTQECL